MWGLYSLMPLLFWPNPWENNLKEGRAYFDLQFQAAVYHEGIMVVRTGLMEATITWSIWSHKSSVRKQREINVGAIVDFSFCTFYSVCGIVLPTLGTGLPFLVKPFWKWLQGPIKRTVFWIILNPIKLAMKVNNHSFQE